MTAMIPLFTCLVVHFINASKTDPEARRMKMGDNGFRPAMNVQLASDGDAQLVVAVNA